MKIFTLASLVLTAGIAACSSVATIVPGATGEAPAGLVYYMPRKDFIATVTITKDAVTAVSVDVTEAYPDLETPYYLNHANQLFGKNVADIQIKNGLLTSSKATVTAQIGDVLKGAATTAGMKGFRSKDDSSSEANKGCADGANKFIVTDGTDRCGVKFSVARLSNEPAKTAADRSSALTKQVGKHSGIFYRQNIPFIIKTASGKIVNESVHFSPSQSPTYYLPISQTFFANNSAEFSFDDGVPKSYKQDTEGEFVALFKLPADVFAAYFAAIGSVFDAFKKNDASQSAALKENLALEVLKKKYDACLLAVQEGDADKVAALKCRE